MNILCLLILSFMGVNAFAAKVQCTTSDHKVQLQLNSKNEILVQINQESVIADGILTNDEVDVVAKFQTFGEMTLFAKVGKVDSSNYLFLKGKRFSVNCR